MPESRRGAGRTGGLVRQPSPSVLFGEVSAWGGAGRKALELGTRAFLRPPGQLLWQGLWPRKEKMLVRAAEEGDPQPSSGAVSAQDTRGQCCAANVAEPQLAAGSPTPLWSLKYAAKLLLERSRAQQPSRPKMLKGVRSSPTARRARCGRL